MSVRVGSLTSTVRRVMHPSFMLTRRCTASTSQQRAGLVGGPGADAPVAGHGPHLEGEVVRRSVEGVGDAPKALFCGRSTSALVQCPTAPSLVACSPHAAKATVRGAGGEVEVKHWDLHARGGGGLLAAVPRRQDHDFEADGVHAELLSSVVPSET